LEVVLLAVVAAQREGFHQGRSQGNFVGGRPFESPGAEHVLTAGTRVRHLLEGELVVAEVERVADDQLGGLAAPELGFFAYPPEKVYSSD
jgi:hypothetical protein